MIPRKLHFIYGLAEDFGGKPFSFVHWAAITTARKLNPDYEIYYWTKYVPQQNRYFEDIREFLHIREIEPPVSIHGRELIHVAHKTDLLRLQILREHGGVYLDMDTVCAKPFNDLLNLQFGIAEERISGQLNGLCNAIVLAQPFAPFIDHWLDSFRTFRSKGHDEYWSEHAVKIPLALAQQFPNDVTILPSEHFLVPDWTRAGLEAMFVDAREFPNAYAHHLWESFSWGALSAINERNAGHLQNSYTQLLMRVIPDEIASLAQKRMAWVTSQLRSRDAKLNLGSGSKHADPFINCDLYPASGADLIFDIASDPWPMPDSSASNAVLSHVLEHLGGDLRHCFAELYRVMTNGGLVEVRVPHPRHDWFLTDPTHVRPWLPDSFDFLDRHKCLNWYFSGDSKSPLALYWNIDFKVESVEVFLPDSSIPDKLQEAFLQPNWRELAPYLNNVVAEIRAILRVRK